jgi:SAM-dependent methyltransferase
MIDERRSYVQQWPAEQFIVPLLARHIDKALREHCAPRSPDAVVLDVGCGGQPLRRPLESMGYEYVSADPRPLPGVPVDLVWPVDAAELPDDPAHPSGFDLVVCTEVLEHVADWQRAWCNLSRLLAGDGRLLITCPAFYFLHEEPWDYWRPTDHAIEHFATAHRLTIVYRQRLGDGFDVLGTLLAGSALEASSDRRKDQFRARVANTLRGCIVRSVAPGGALRRHLRANSNVYLSNLMVLAK